MRQQNTQKPKRKAKIKILVSELVFDDSQLIIAPTSQIRPEGFRTEAHRDARVRPGLSGSYDATLTNAVPKGDITPPERLDRGTQRHLGLEFDRKYTSTMPT